MSSHKKGRPPPENRVADQSARAENFQSAEKRRVSTAKSFRNMEERRVSTLKASSLSNRGYGDSRPPPDR